MLINIYKLINQKKFKNKIIRILKKFFFTKPFIYFIQKSIVLSKSYPSYSFAKSKSVGYESNVVLLKVRNTVLKLIKKEFAYERDGTGFTLRPANLPIENILKKYKNQIELIIDFGGGLGGMFISYQDIISKFVKKIILEQESMVNEGRKIMKENNLDIEFYKDVSELNLNSNNSLLIASSVLTYLPSWEEILEKIIKKTNPKYIFIDRQALSNSKKDKFFVQYNGNYYSENVSYPFTLISKNKLIKFVSSKRYILEEMDISPIEKGYPKHYYLFFKKI